MKYKANVSHIVHCVNTHDTLTALAHDLAEGLKAIQKSAGKYMLKQMPDYKPGSKLFDSRYFEIENAFITKLLARAREAGVLE